MRAVLGLWLFLVVGTVYRSPGFLFGWDSFGYHLYLPGTFVQHDPVLHDLTWVEHARSTYDASGTLYQISQFPDGTHVVKYPMGLAVLWSPWFVAGHLVALASGQNADGYSIPYQWAVRIGVLFYLLLGLLALRAVLLSMFTERATSATLALIVLGTNLLDQGMMGLSMPHIVLFCLYAGILWYTIKWSPDRRPKYAVPLGLLMGLAMLVRPSEGVCVLLPFLWRAENEEVNPFKRARTSRKQWAMILGVMLVVGFPQFLYWKVATGHWILDPYNNAGEGFDLFAPHTWNFLISFRKGWYLYTPLMLIGTCGILLLKRFWREAFLPVLVFFLFNLYILSSWTCWWYADSFSSRAMVGSYAVMALPLAAFVQWIATLKGAKRLMLVLILAGCVFLNLFQYWQFTQGIIHSSRMTRAAYIAAFGKTTMPEDMEDLLLVRRSYSGDQGLPDSTRYTKKFLPEAILKMLASPLDTVVRDSANAIDRHAYRLDAKNNFSPALHIPFRDITLRDHAWVEAQWSVFVPSVPVKGSFVLAFEHHGQNYAYNARDLEKMDLRPGKWNTVSTFYLTPEPRSTSDPFVSYFWLRDTVPILVDGPHIIIHEAVDPR